MLSERDIIQKVSFNKTIDLPHTQIKSIMTTKIITCNQDTESNVLMTIMTNNKIRHIPIIKQGSLIGIVSIGDVVKHLINKIEEENKNLKDYINSY